MVYIFFNEKILIYFLYYYEYYLFGNTVITLSIKTGRCEQIS